MKIARDVLKDMKKLDKFDKLGIIFELLKDGDIKFTEVSIKYTQYLEGKNRLEECKKRIMASCLSSLYNPFKEMEFIHARSSILLQPYVPNDFIKDFILSKTSDKEVKKEIEYICKSLNESLNHRDWKK